MQIANFWALGGWVVVVVVQVCGKCLTIGSSGTLGSSIWKPCYREFYKGLSRGLLWAIKGATRSLDYGSFRDMWYFRVQTSLSAVGVENLEVHGCVRFVVYCAGSRFVGSAVGSHTRLLAEF